MSSGRLRRLEFVDHEKEAIIAKFKNIHGVGKVIAHQFYAQVQMPMIAPPLKPLYEGSLSFFLF